MALNIFVETSDFLADTCSFAVTTFEVVKLRAANPPRFKKFNLADAWRQNRENPFNTNAVGYFPHSEGFAGTFATTLDYRTLELLNSFFISFLDFNVNVYSITWLKIG